MGSPVNAVDRFVVGSAGPVAVVAREATVVPEGQVLRARRTVEAQALDRLDRLDLLARRALAALMARMQLCGARYHSNTWRVDA